MKTIAIALLAISLLAGCAGKPMREPTSVKLNDGTNIISLKLILNLVSKAGIGPSEH